MPAQDYSDLSRLALRADLDVDELRARLARMTDRAVLECGRATAYMCTPYANLGSRLAVRHTARGGPGRVTAPARAGIISRGVAL
jgi:hypothetical protein